MHWLRLTLWAPLDRVQGVVEDALGDLLDEWVGEGERWCLRPPRGRVSASWGVGQGAYLWVDEFGVEPYRQVVVTGKGCDVLGIGGQARLLQTLRACGLRWRASAVHVAFDGFPMSVAEVLECLDRRDVRTRCRLEPEYIRSESGETVYTRARPEKSGVERYIRWYDMRGPVRLECVWKKRWAAVLVEQLAECGSVAGWAELVLGYVRDYLDLTEPSGDGNRCRRGLHPQWKQFVGEVQRAGVSVTEPQVDPQGLEWVGKYDGACERASRALCEGAEAFGWDWVRERLEYHGAGRVQADAVARLQAVRAQAAHLGVAGVPHWPEALGGEDAPF